MNPSFGQHKRRWVRLLNSTTEIWVVKDEPGSRLGAKQVRLPDLNSEEIGTRIIRANRWRQLNVSRMVTCAKEILNPFGPFKDWISLVLCVISISIDPLFFYIPVIQRKKYCMDLNKRLAITSCAVRTVIDILYMILASSHYDFPYRSPKFYIDLLTVLPLTQMVIIIIVSTMRVSKFLVAMRMLILFLLIQFVPRVIRIYPLFKKATRISGVLAEVIWAKAAFNLYLYLLAGHVFGAVWYFFAIQREVKCWKSTCRFETRCEDQSFYCYKNSGSFSFLEDYCSTKTRNTTLIDFGIYHAALDSGVAEGTFPQKFVYCFRWGLQSLSCFAQNLVTSVDIGENALTISIIISSMLLFIFLIGNMQLYLQIGTARSEEMKLKVREIEQWMPFKMLPEDLQLRVKNYQQYVWQETKGIDVENLLNNLPKDLRRSIKRELCLQKIQKVPLFALIHEQHLDAICERLKPVLYSKDTYIVREGDPVDEMLFIVGGKLLIVSSGRDNYFCDASYTDDFCGDILSTWAIDPQSSSDLPISTKTIRTHDQVVGFAIMADDLKDVFTRFMRPHPKRLLHPFRYHSLRWRRWAACFIQVAWQKYHVKKLEERRLEDEERLLNAPTTADGNSTSSSVGATRYVSRFAANALHAIRRNSVFRGRMLEKVPIVHLQKPLDPDVADEEEMEN